jgi:2-dehydro-3-deoxy-phosphogluconate/2-dehydro-3-deoxy-6-phosphogalactonate aldolase
MGRVLWEAFDANLEFVLTKGAHGIMAMGSTAEFPHFELETRQQILERITTACERRGNLPVIANVSHVNCRAAIDLARHAKSHGAMVAAVLAPWFFPIEQRDLAEFFISIGHESGLPLGLYNFPEVSGKKIELGTVRTVAQAVKVIAVKQSGAEFGYHEELLELGKDLGFSVLTGADNRLPEALALGCAGTVSGLANVAPDTLREIYDGFEKRIDTSAAAGLMKRITEGMSPLPFPLNVKAAIAARGLETGEPKNPISRETEATYRKAVAALRPLFNDHGQ